MGRRIPAALSAVTVASVAGVCGSSAGPVRLIAGLGLAGALACALWSVRRARFGAIVPAVGLTLVFLILAGLALAAVHGLSTVPVALVVGVATLVAARAGAGRGVRLTRPNVLAAVGAVVFVAAVGVAVHRSADSAAADSGEASSVAIWAYPSGGLLHVGVEQPAGHGATSLRIVVTRAGVTVAAWNDVRLAPGQTWEAPALGFGGGGGVRVVALHGATVVASLSAPPAG